MAPRRRGRDAHARGARGSSSGVCAAPGRWRCCVVGWPKAGDALVALRPHELAPLAVQDEIYALFGGERGQWVVLAIDADPRARARARAIASQRRSTASPRTASIASFDALTTFAPSPAIAARAPAGARRARSPVARAARSRRALAATRASTSTRARPRSRRSAIPRRGSRRGRTRAGRSAGSWRATARSTTAGRSSRSTCVRADDEAKRRARPRGDPSRRPRRDRHRVHAPRGRAQGHARARSPARRARARSSSSRSRLRAALGRAGDVVLAILDGGRRDRDRRRPRCARCTCGGTCTTRSFSRCSSGSRSTRRCSSSTRRATRRRARTPIAHTLEAQGPLVAATALTTAAGFAALLACRFDGLYDLGAVGALGSVAGLLCALLLVPAGLRLTRKVVG